MNPASGQLRIGDVGIPNPIRIRTMSDLARAGFVMQPYASAFYNGNPMSRLCFDGERNGGHSSPEHNFSGVWTHKWLCSCAKRTTRRPTGTGRFLA